MTFSARGLRRTLAPDAVPGAHALHTRIVAKIVDAVGAMKGPAAAASLRASGLEALHTVLDPLDVGPLRDRVLDCLREDLLRFAARIGRTVLGWHDDFYIDDYLILRVNFPYAVARAADGAAENPGIGRLSPSVRAAAAARRVRDPRYDPRGYHRNHPPAAWAHGPHVDSWTGHSKDGINVWWAISDVPADAGMVLYPSVTPTDVACDPRSLYVRSGYALPPPAFVPLAAGELLVFDPELLHGTHLNVSAQTRVAVSLRLNERRPAFDPDCFYAREFWRRASDVVAGRSTVLHLKREEHLAARAPAPARPPAAAPTVTVAPGDDATAVALGPASLLAEGERFTAAMGDRRVLVLRTPSGVHAFDAACPHYGIDLSDGGAQGETLACPGCAVGFDVRTGGSASPCLTLTTYPVREADGTLYLDLVPVPC
ncbi:MAG: phytanoyl-CoA dioxygenase family protein [Candidatus Eremiobacteraeota bacterium]|nr:phytanoyl-CoA dioxygenase family protein [Candidatus Eremiobacteraeota bacterium]